jgi:predicted tellurium resistance membrane protein TerC
MNWLADPESLHQHIPKGYIYFAMGFSVLVELLNLRLRKVRAPVKLHEPYVNQVTETQVQEMDTPSPGTK